jgi:hypothetical protein
VFSGAFISSLAPIVFYLIKDMSYFDIALNPLTWETKKKIARITSDDSKINVYINNLTLPEIMYSLTKEYIEKHSIVDFYNHQILN